MKILKKVLEAIGLKAKEKEYYWTFENNNKYCKYTYTYEQAKALNDTLLNCSDCTDCKNCTNCIKCFKSTYCYNCVGCTYCDNCSDCVWCISCKKCQNCYKCHKCDNIKNDKSEIWTEPARSENDE